MMCPVFGSSVETVFFQDPAMPHGKITLFLSFYYYQYLRLSKHDILAMFVTRIFALFGSGETNLQVSGVRDQI